MRQCPSCGRENSNYDKYCPICHYYLGRVKDESDQSDAKIYVRRAPVIECPYCHSTNTERISGLNRSLLFADASAVGKQFQCNSCSAFF